ncbi:hypothetical protein STENM223S_04229 [Streptomyces tendae]
MAPVTRTVPAARPGAVTSTAAGDVRVQDPAVTDGAVRLSRGHRGEQRAVVGVGGVAGQVQELEPAGVLGLGGAHQSPQCGPGHVGQDHTGRDAGRARGDGGAGDEHQPGVGEALVGQPAAHQLVRPGQQAAYRVGHGLPVGAPGFGGHQDHVGHGHAGVDRLGEGLQVGVGLQVDAGLVQGRGDTVVAGAEDDPAHRLRRRHGRGRDGLPPVEAQQFGPVLGGRGRRRAQGDGVGGGDRPAGRVGDEDGVSVVVTGGGQPYPQRGGAGGVQGQSGPRERQHRRGGLVAGPHAGAAHQERVGGGVQEGGVQTVAGRVPAVRLGQFDLGEHLVAALPHRAQSAEAGTVREPGRGEGGVGVLVGDDGGAGRRPGGQVAGRLGGRLRGEDALACGRQSASSPPGRDQRIAEGTAAGLVGGVDGDLDGDGVPFGYDEEG